MFSGKCRHRNHSSQSLPNSFGMQHNLQPFFSGNSPVVIQQKTDQPFFKPQASSSIKSRLNANIGNGNPLPANSKAQMENTFGTDFSNVRLHTDGVAVQMNKDLQAQAFTHGSDIYFSAGKYDPDSSIGKHLLAHELTHVAQQGKTDKAGISGLEDKTLIQRQPQQEEREPKDITKGPVPASSPAKGSFRAGRCLANPEFPDFGCFAGQLKLDVDENLQSNAYQFYRVASLHPGDNELMWNTFLRYGLGVNLLQTSFGFLGANKKWETILSYGAGIGMKSYQFASNGELKLDIPIPLGKGINLDIKFDLNTNPDKPAEEKVNTSIGISGRF